jgi:hypothetical protein
MQSVIGRNPSYLLTAIRILRGKSSFYAMFRMSPGAPAVINAQKTIGAYTESISIGPELIQNQRAN